MKYMYLLLVLGLCFACSKKKEASKSEGTKLMKSYVGEKDKEVKFDTVHLEKVRFKDSIKDWKGYHKIDALLKVLKTSTPNELLYTADDFVKDIKLMKDSIPVESLKKPGMRARINGMYNQALRLKEMSTIPAITVDEVVKQTVGLYAIFNMITTKVNAIYDQENFENELLEEDFIFSKIDSIQ